MAYIILKNTDLHSSQITKAICFSGTRKSVLLFFSDHGKGGLSGSCRPAILPSSIPYCSEVSKGYTSANTQMQLKYNDSLLLLGSF